MWCKSYVEDFQLHSEADPENSESGGRVPLPSPPPEWKLHLLGHAAYSICEHICDAK